MATFITLYKDGRHKCIFGKTNEVVQGRFEVSCDEAENRCAADGVSFVSKEVIKEGKEWRLKVHATDNGFPITYGVVARFD